jgi:hypothetical protein
MRATLVTLSVAFLAACTTGRDAESEFSGEAARAAEQAAMERCAAEGKRAQLRNVFENSDGSRRYEYLCVQ